MSPCSIEAGSGSWLVRRPGGPVLVVGIERAPLFLGWLAGGGVDGDVELDRLRAAVGLHRPHKNQVGQRTQTCWQCGRRWPCRTRRVADGEVAG